MKDKKETKEVEKQKVEEVCEMIPKSEYDELNERYKRILAEFENFKKRSTKEREGLYGSVLSDVVSVILPVVDNLENALKTETKDEKYKEGIVLVEKQMKDALKAKLVEEIKTVGEAFDPELHEAVSSVESDKHSTNQIVEEYRKGYKIGNKVIRHSMVVVAK